VLNFVHDAWGERTGKSLRQVPLLSIRLQHGLGPSCDVRDAAGNASSTSRIDPRNSLNREVVRFHVFPEQRSLMRDVTNGTSRDAILVEIFRDGCGTGKVRQSNSHALKPNNRGKVEVVRFNIFNDSIRGTEVILHGTSASTLNRFSNTPAKTFACRNSSFLVAGAFAISHGAILMKITKLLCLYRVGVGGGVPAARRGGRWVILDTSAR